MVHRSKLCALATLALLLAGCGDDLESRNAAALASEGGEQQIVLRPSSSTGGGTFTAEAPAQPAAEAAFDERTGKADSGQPQVHEAAPEELMDTTTGFDPTPMDNATGTAPEPAADDDWGA